MSTAVDVRDDRRRTTVPLVGLNFPAVSERDTSDHVLEGLAEGRGCWNCPANLDVLRQWRESREVRDLISRTDTVSSGE